MVELEVYGDYGLFSDPSTRIGGEKFSMMVPTYEALKGILNSCYWKPGIIWIIDKVRIMNPIQFESKGIRTTKYNNMGTDLSYYTYLKQCRYQIQAHFIFNKNRPEFKQDWNEKKHYNIAKRAIDKGGRRDVFLGCRECQAYVVPCTFGEGKGFYDDVEILDFGILYHGITYADEAYSDETKDSLTIRFAEYLMKNGVIELIPPENCIHRHVRKMNMKKFPQVEKGE